jgi:hypothetical protein
LPFPTNTSVPTNDRTMYLKNPEPVTVYRNSPLDGRLSHREKKIFLTVDREPSVGFPNVAKS